VLQNASIKILCDIVMKRKNDEMKECLNDVPKRLISNVLGWERKLGTVADS